jgi:hypothetical protein
LKSLIAQNRRGLRLQRVDRKLGHNFALKRIYKADPEDVIAHLCDQGTGRGRGDHRNIGLLCDWGGSQTIAGGDLAYESVDLVLIDKLCDNRRRLFRSSLIVFIEYLDLPTGDASRFADFVGRHLCSVGCRLPEVGGAARQIAVDADSDRPGI